MMKFLMHGAIAATSQAIADNGNAVDQDGSTNFVFRNTAPTGLTNSPYGLISLWINPDVLNAQQSLMLMGAVDVRYNQNGGAGSTSITSGSVILRTVGATSKSILFPSNQIIAGQWNNLLISWNTGSGAKAKVFINDVDVGASYVSNSGGDVPVDYSITEATPGYTIGSYSSGNYYTGCIAYAYFTTPAAYYDLSITENRRKFVTADLKRVGLGVDGSLPTGTPPLVYLNGNASNWHINAGSGGDFTPNGTFNNCTSAPITNT